MLSKNEINLIKLIKYTPALIVILVCAITTTLLYVDKNIALDKDLKSLENAGESIIIKHIEITRRNLSIHILIKIIDFILS